MSELAKQGLLTAVVCSSPFVALARTQARTFGVPARPSGAGFDHGVFLYLVDPHGQVAETFHPNVTTDRLTQRLRTRLATR